MNSKAFESPKSLLFRNKSNKDLYPKSVRIVVFILGAIAVIFLALDVNRYFSGSMALETELVGVASEFFHVFSKIPIIVSVFLVWLRLKGVFWLCIVSISIVAAKVYLYVDFVNSDSLFEKGVDPLMIAVLCLPLIFYFYIVWACFPVRDRTG